MAAQVVIRCFVGGVVLLLAWCGAIIMAPEWLFTMNASRFAITREQFVMVNYCGIAVVKLIVCVFFSSITFACGWC
jgi:hypothetical protein